MENAAATAEERWTSGRGILTLWTVGLVGPVVWAIRFTFAYVLAGVACTGGGIVAMAVMSIVAIGLSLTGAWVAWGIWREIGPGSLAAGGVAGRTRFMAISAVALGLAFAWITLIESIPLFMIEPCRT